MLRLYEKLSSRQRFWWGFFCGPLLSWFGVAVLALLIYLFASRGMSNSLLATYTWLPIFLNGAGLLYLCGIPLFSGFSTAFLWRGNSTDGRDDDTVQFWSVALTWSPVLIYVALGTLFLNFSIEVLLGLPVILCIPTFIFMVLYKVGLNKGRKFWNSSQPRHLLGDLSDFGSLDEKQSQ